MPVHSLFSKSNIKFLPLSTAESASLDTLKNAVRSFQHHKVINCYQVANLRMLELHYRYQQERDLYKLIDSFEAYRL